MNDALINMIPAPDTLPVAAGWFIFLSYLTYYLHLLSAGTMFGVSVMAAVGHFKGKTDPGWKALGNRMSKVLPFTIAFAVNLGVAPLLFLQVLYGNFFYTASIVIGIPWLLLFVLIIIGYYAAYWLVFKRGETDKGGGGLAVFISLVLTWAAFMLVNINTLMMVPQRWKAYFSSPSGLNLNISEVTLFPRFLLYLFLFLTIGGTFGAIFYTIKKYKESALGLHFSSRVSGSFAILSIPAIILFILKLPGNISRVFFFGDGLWTLLVTVVLTGLAVVGFLMMKGKIIPGTLVLALDMILFVILRNHIRYLYLQPYKEKFSALAQNTQYDVLVLFLIILVLGLAVVAWMLIKTAKEFKTQS